MFEAIARATKKAMNGARFYSDDVHDTTTMEFWLRSYVAHLRAAHDKFTAASSVATDSTNPDGACSFIVTQPPHVCT